VAVDGSGLAGVGSLLLRVILVLFGSGSFVLVGPVSAERCTNVETVAESSLHEALELLEVLFWSDGPVIDSDRGDSSQREHVELLHGLVIRSEMPGCKHVTVDQRLERVHAVKDNHGSAFAENG